MFFRVVLVFFGIMLALSIHFLKMLVRLFGEGCLTQCITVLEVTTVCVSVLASIFMRQLAIFFASVLLIAACYSAKRKWEKLQDEQVQQGVSENQHGEGTNAESNGNPAHSDVTNDYVQMDGAVTETPSSEAEKHGPKQVLV